MTTAASAVAASPSRRRWFSLGGLLLMIGLGVFLYVVHIGWNHTLLDQHGFRQTQTAISALFMVGEVPKLAYETPLLGPPWSIPFEFPLYQWIVAALVTLFRTPLDQTGRFVSVGSLVLTFVPVYFMLGKLKVSAGNRLLVLALLATTPIYLFWSRTFLIETLVLFLSAAYLACAWEFLENQRPAWALAAVLLGSLAAMVKITTFTLFLGLLLTIYGLRWLQRLYSLAPLGRPLYHLQVLGLLVVLPLVCTQLWTQFADRQKERNPFGGKCITSRSLQTWNFGTLQERRDWQKWRAIRALAQLGINEKTPLLCGAGLFLASAAWLVFRRRGPDRYLPPEHLGQRWLASAVCYLFYLSGPLIFFNLYVIHDYYYCGNTLFLIVGMGLCLVTIMEMGVLGKLVGATLALLVMGGSLQTYAGHYYELQSCNQDALLSFCAKIEASAPPGTVVVNIGHNWFGDLAYYSKRRSIVPPNWIPVSLEEQVAQMAAIQGETLAALVIDRDARDQFPPEKVLKLWESHGFQTALLATHEKLDLYSLKKAESPPSASAR